MRASLERSRLGGADKEERSRKRRGEEQEEIEARITIRESYDSWKIERIRAILLSHSASDDSSSLQVSGAVTRLTVYRAVQNNTPPR